MSVTKRLGFGAVTLALLALLIPYPTDALAQSREELDKWAQKLLDIRNIECKNEHKKKVRGKIEYAAILLAHSEVDEAESSVAKAAANANDAKCREALIDNGTLGSVN
ncbi:MAG: hypothetical protein OEZ32_05845 [Nitrospinota bacterium]|nr:hypothetical protein [Nitrospinota bacterium]